MQTFGSLLLLPPLLLLPLLLLLLLQQYCYKCIIQQRVPSQHRANHHCNTGNHSTPPPHLHPLLHTRPQVMIWHQRSAGQQRPAFGTGGVAEGQLCKGETRRGGQGA